MKRTISKTADSTCQVGGFDVFVIPIILPIVACAVRRHQLLNAQQNNSEKKHKCTGSLSTKCDSREVSDHLCGGDRLHMAPGSDSPTLQRYFPIFSPYLCLLAWYLLWWNPGMAPLVLQLPLATQHFQELLRVMPKIWNLSARFTEWAHFMVWKWVRGSLKCKDFPLCSPFVSPGFSSEHWTWIW